ncbi:hypothetical protein RCDURKIN_3 [Rhodobacter phage RcDurkin]|nr:hypothetical protein RCDURKIN_3 [Rhodobacter phage RcDurkin]UUV43747.1 hypothetical protein RCKICKAPOO_6 [Rhodobacter phage RcKickapoo]
MVVVVNGNPVHREIDHYEPCEFTGQMLPVPVLAPNERITRTISGTVIVIRG